MRNKVLFSTQGIQLTHVDTGTYLNDIYTGTTHKISPEVARAFTFFMQGATLTRACQELADIKPQLPKIVLQMQQAGLLKGSRKPAGRQADIIQANFFQPPPNTVDTEMADALPPLLCARDILNAAFGLYGIAKAHIIQTALDIDLFTLAGNHDINIRQLAKKVVLRPRMMSALIDALKELGLFHKNEDSCRATLLAETFLNRNSPSYLYSLDFSTAAFRAWQALPAALASGKSPKDFVRQVWGGKSSVWVNRAMSAISFNIIPQIAKKLNLKSARRMLDLGGGVGVWSLELSRRFPDLRVVVFDQPEVIKTTRANITAAGAQKRISTLTGNFFKESFGKGYDVVLMVNVIHCNRAVKNRILIMKAFRALKKGGRIIIVNQMRDAHGGGNTEFSLFTFLMYNTFLHSCGEITAWLEEAGLSRVRSVSLSPSKFTAIVGTK